MTWMAWTPPTAFFFIGVAVLLLTMAGLQLAFPTVERKGLLPMSTTRGDRLFIGLMASGYIHLIWLALTDDLPLWGGSIVAVVFLAALLRWG